MNFEYMKNFMDSLTEWIIPGNSVVIYKDGKKVFEYSSGYSDLEKKIKKTGEEQLYIYSCSKVATVTAALQLYEQGKFLLSDPLYEYLPEFKKMYVKDGDRIKAAENPITIRDLFTMTAGLSYATNTPAFEKARKMAPCIVFIDEIDAIGKSRDSHYGGGNDEREQTLNQLLAEMDGFDTSKGLLILAATNRPEVLDKALLRPGRFDRRIIVDKPDLKGRLETLKVHSKDVLMDETVDLDALALATAGLVGSDLANMINEAAINAVKKGRKYVNQADLFEAFELVAVGGKEKKDRVMSDKERKIVSYHKVGHAIVRSEEHTSELQSL